MTHTVDWELQTVRTIADLTALRSEWNDFLREPTDSCGLHDFTYLTSLLRREASTPLVVVVRKSGVMKAIAPFIHWNGTIPLRLSLIKLGEVTLPRLRLVGDDLSIAHDVDAKDVYGRVFHELGNLTDVVAIEAQDVSTSGRLWQYVSDDTLDDTKWRLSRTGNAQTCHTIRFPTSFHDYMEGLKSRDRTNLRRRHKKFMSFFDGDVKLVRVSTAQQVEMFLSTLDCIYGSTWQSQVYGRRARKTDRESDFFTALAELGWLRSYLLIGKEQPLAFQVGIQYHAHYEFLETGYDSQWANLGPGTVLEYLVLEDLMSSNRPEYGDFGFGDAEYKRILANSTHLELEHVYLTRRWSVKPKLVFGTQAMIDAIEKGGRKVLDMTGMDRIARRMLRRGGKVRES